MSFSDSEHAAETRRRYNTGDLRPAGKPGEATDQDKAASKESCRVSSRDKEIQRAKEAVEATPDIREDRVAAAKQALKSGRLNMCGAELAEKLLSDDFHGASVDT